MKFVYSLIIWGLMSLMSLGSVYVTDFTQVTLSTDVLSTRSHERILFEVDFKHKEGWHSYWVNPGDSGLRTRITWDLPDGFTAQQTRWPAPQSFDYESLINYGYKESVRFTTPIQVDASVEAGEYALAGTISWLVCADICIPERVPFSLGVTVGDERLLSERGTEVQSYYETMDYDRYPTSLSPVDGGSRLTVSVPHERVGLSPQFFVEQSDLMVAADQQMIEMTSEGLSVWLPGQTPPDVMSGVITFADQAPIRIDYDGEGGKEWILKVLGIVGFAFLGGLILNLMPCVLPILSLKLVTILDTSRADQVQIKRQAVAYTAGVLVTFLLIVVALLGLKWIGLQLGWGFQLQSPLFVMILAIVMVSIGAHFNGLFEMPQWLLSVPGQLSGTHYALTVKHSYKDFFTGMLAVIVATPCTAPFMAPSIGFALTQPPLIMVLIFMALGCGFSAPFLAIAMAPQLATWIPSPGSWMTTFKHVLAIPMYLTGLWLIWVLSHQIGPFGWILGGVQVLLISGLIVINRQSFRFQRVCEGILIIGMIITCALVVQSKDYTRHDNQPVFEQLETLVAAKQRVFVDVTASWCITCKTNETLVLYTDEIQAYFKEQNITFITLDWTDYDAAITDYLASFNRVGVPLYIYYDENGSPTLLPQLLTKDLIYEL